MHGSVSRSEGFKFKGFLTTAITIDGIVDQLLA